jgi:hypothetical protein
MATFPQLKTGAICQYPLGRRIRFATEVIAFSDGSEQRYRDYGSGLRAWKVDLSLLDDAEMASIEAFYWANDGGAGTFQFTDPFDSVVYDSCEFGEGPVEFVASGQQRVGMSLIIRERRS